MERQMAATQISEQSVTLDQMYAFLRQHYRHDRFEGRVGWPSDGFTSYPVAVAQGRLDYLRTHGVGRISRHESRTGLPIKFDGALRIIDDGAGSQQ